MDKQNYTKMPIQKLKYKLRIIKTSRECALRMYRRLSSLGVDWYMTDYYLNRIDEYQCLMHRIQNVIMYKEILNHIKVDEIEQYYFGD